MMSDWDASRLADWNVRRANLQNLAAKHFLLWAPS